MVTFRFSNTYKLYYVRSTLLVDKCRYFHGCSRLYHIPPYNMSNIAQFKVDHYLCGEVPSIERNTLRKYEVLYNETVTKTYCIREESMYDELLAFSIPLTFSNCRNCRRELPYDSVLRKAPTIEMFTPEVSRNRKYQIK